MEVFFCEKTVMPLAQSCCRCCVAGPRSTRGSSAQAAGGWKALPRHGRGGVRPCRPGGPQRARCLPLPLPDSAGPRVFSSLLMHNVCSERRAQQLLRTDVHGPAADSSPRPPSPLQAVGTIQTRIRTASSPTMRRWGPITTQCVMANTAPVPAIHSRRPPYGSTSGEGGQASSAPLRANSLDTPYSAQPAHPVSDYPAARARSETTSTVGRSSTRTRPRRTLVRWRLRRWPSSSWTRRSPS